MLCFSLGYFTSRNISTSIGVNPKMYQENDSLRYVILQKDSLINEISTERDYFENQVDEMSDEMSLKESEISYWGRKCDSLQKRSKK